jgi:hypothetical protein
MMDRQIGGLIRKAVKSGDPEELRRLLEMPGNLAYINSQGIVSLSFNQIIIFSIGWCDCTHVHSGITKRQMS